MKNNLLGKKPIFSCSFYLYRFCKYVSYGFLIINFCNSGVHYETPCILSTRYTLLSVVLSYRLKVFGFGQLTFGKTPSVCEIQSVSLKLK